jgi:sec-independent protein translocase protein TatB
MFDFDIGKVFLFGMVALVVVGPKDLPPWLRMLGQIIGRIRKTSDEFKRQFAEVINDADLDGIQHQLDAIARSPIEIAVNPQTTMRSHLPSIAEASQTAVAESPTTAPAETTYISPEMQAYLPPAAEQPKAEPVGKAPEVGEPLHHANAGDSRR